MPSLPITEPKPTPSHKISKGWIGILILIGITSLVLPLSGLFLALPIAVQAYRTRNKIFYIATAIMVFLTVLAVPMQNYYFSKFRKYEAVNQEPHLTQYNQMEEYILDSKTPGNSTRFQKPIEFSKISTQILDSSSAATISHNNNEGRGVSTLTVSSLSSELLKNPDYVTGVKSLMDAPEGKPYEDFMAPLRQFILSSTPQGYRITLSKPVSFNNETIQENAWQFDFTATSSDSNPKLPTLKGKFIYILGKGAFYHYALFSLDYNWDTNKPAWDRITQSIRINE